MTNDRNWTKTLAVAGLTAVLAAPFTASADQRGYGGDGRGNCHSRGYGMDDDMGRNMRRHMQGYHRDGGGRRGYDDDDRGESGWRRGDGQGRGMRGGRMHGYMDDDDMGRGMRRGQGMGRGMGQNMDGGRRMPRRFAAIDLNEDGKISDDEASGMRESVFLAMDADDNGELTKEEYMAVRMGPGPRNENGGQRRQERQNQKMAQKEPRFAPMDADSNGTVSKAEWMAAGLARFKAADSDGDGTVTPWEFRSQHRDR